MSVTRVIERVEQLDFELSTLPRHRPSDRILMAAPEFYDVDPVIEVDRGQDVRRIDRFQARRQWKALLDGYTRIDMPVDILPGLPLLPDLVFIADPCLPVPPGILSASPAIVRSIMRSARRQAEVRPVAEFLEARGLWSERFDPFAVPSIEGLGDARWCGCRSLLILGQGANRASEAARAFSAWSGLPVILIELVDERFHHLDTCLSVIDEQRAIFFPGAFSDQGVDLLRALFPRLIEVDEDERAACGGHSPDGEHFLMQGGSPRISAALSAIGLSILEFETGEFLASGGSVASLVLPYWAGPVQRSGTCSGASGLPSVQRCPVSSRSSMK